jgi:hypothetical protein
MEKNLQSEKFHYFFWTPLGSRVSIKINFFLQKPAELVAKFAASVVDTGGAPCLANISANVRKISK